MYVPFLVCEPSDEIDTMGIWTFQNIFYTRHTRRATPQVGLAKFIFYWYMPELEHATSRI